MEKKRNPLYSDISPFSDGAKYQKGDWQKIPEITHSDTEIKGFFGEYRKLSNFGHAIIELDDQEYDSVEKAYQASKWKIEDRGFFINCTNEEAITYNLDNIPNKYTPEEWDELKLKVMRFLLEQKFDPDQNPENYQLLQKTGEKYLEETNWWNDTFWGKNLQGEGENNLGKLIMDIRDSYRQNTK